MVVADFWSRPASVVGSVEAEDADEVPEASMLLDACGNSVGKTDCRHSGNLPYTRSPSKVADFGPSRVHKDVEMFRYYGIGNSRGHDLLVSAADLAEKVSQYCWPRVETCGTRSRRSWAGGGAQVHTSWTAVYISR